MIAIGLLFTAFVLIGGALYGLASLLLWFGALRCTKSLRADQPPTVSVVVPARNEARNIGACLKALAAQSYPRDRWEVIVVDDRSEDGTGELVRGLSLTMPVSVRLITVAETPAGWSPKKHAITRAIGESTGEVILTTDADCRPEPEWVSGMVGTLVGARAGLVAGYSPYDGRETLVGRLLALETLSQGFLTMAGIGAGVPITCQGRSFGYRRRVFEEAGGFGAAHAMLSGDDHLFLQRAVSRGFRAAYCDEGGSHVLTDPPKSVEGFVQQRIRMFSGLRRLSVPVALLGTLVYGWLLSLFVGAMLVHPIAFAAFLGKMALDAVSLSIAARRLREWRLMLVYPIAAVLYVPYYLTFAFLGTFGTYRWKGMTGG